MGTWSDAGLLEALRMVDEGPKEVTDWEAKFIESMLKREWPLSPGQREKIIEIVERYKTW
ncbi:hypothetical protein KKH23_04960 [Patescibacteria group bacterium]|nr:hypothetical protein [Patescibacteria group bacterium]